MSRNSPKFSYVYLSKSVHNEISNDSFRSHFTPQLTSCFRTSGKQGFIDEEFRCPSQVVDDQEARLGFVVVEVSIERANRLAMHNNAAWLQVKRKLRSLFINSIVLAFTEFVRTRNRKPWEDFKRESEWLGQCVTGVIDARRHILTEECKKRLEELERVPIFCFENDPDQVAKSLDGQLSDEPEGRKTIYVISSGGNTDNFAAFSEDSIMFARPETVPSPWKQFIQAFPFDRWKKQQEIGQTPYAFLINNTVSDVASHELTGESTQILRRLKQECCPFLLALRSAPTTVPNHASGATSPSELPRPFSKGLEVELLTPPAPELDDNVVYYVARKPDVPPHERNRHANRIRQGSNA